MEIHIKRIWNLDLIEEILIHSKNIIINISKANLFSHLHSNQHLRKKRKQIGEDAGNCFVGTGTGRGKGTEGNNADFEAGLPADVAGNIPLTEFSAPLAPPPLFRSNLAIIDLLHLFVRSFIRLLLFYHLDDCLFVFVQSRHNFQQTFNQPPTDHLPHSNSYIGDTGPQFSDFPLKNQFLLEKVERAWEQRS